MYLTNSLHVAVRLFSNRSQMRTKCGKNKEVAPKPQASVSLMFLSHFDVLCDLLLNRSLCLFMVRKEKDRYMYLPRTSWLFGGLCYFRHFFSPKHYYWSLLLLFSLSYLYTVSSKSFPTSFLAQSEINNGENILQNSESLVAITHDGNCCEDIL